MLRKYLNISLFAVIAGIAFGLAHSGIKYTQIYTIVIIGLAGALLNICNFIPKKVKNEPER